jgi:hypothetical protein
LAAFLKDWPEIQSKLAELSRTPERLLEIMSAINTPLSFTQLLLPVSEAQAHFAFMNAPLMRKRLTLGDVLIFLNWDRQRLWKDVWSVMR